MHYQLTHQIPYGILVNEQHTITGETALATACRIGDFQATFNLLDRGANPSILDHSGCLPLHWLCMFDDDHVDAVALRLTQDWAIQHINFKSSTPRVPDDQFPLVFHGTALMFAVATCSTQAVKTLLALGADPMCGFAEEDPEWGDRSALTSATCLHLVDKLHLFGRVLRQNWEVYSVATLTCALTKSSIIERYLIHGQQYRLAMKGMVSFFRDTMGTFGESGCQPLWTNRSSRERPGLRGC